MPRLFVGLDEPKRQGGLRFVPLELEADTTGVGWTRGAGVPVELRIQFRRCSNPTCSGCPHGPYAYWRARHPNGRDQVKYFGALPQTSELWELAKKTAPRRRAGGRR